MLYKKRTNLESVLQNDNEFGYDISLHDNK